MVVPSRFPRRTRGRGRQGESQYELGRAAIYIRISGAADKREASLDTQKAGIMRRLRELGYTCGEEDVFCDKFTGKETIRRPALNKLREACRRGVYKAIGVHKLDRLSRNMGQCFILLCEMDELNIRPVSVLEHDIDNTPQGKMYRMMGAYMGEAELATLEDRFGRGREDIRERGLPLSRGKKAYGLIFNKSTRTYLLDEDRPDHDGTIKWVRDMFERAAAGTSAHAIAIHLNAMKVKPPGLASKHQFSRRPHSGRWSSRVVVTILRNPVYKGWTIEGKYYSEGPADTGFSINRKLPPEEWIVLDRTGRITPRVVDDATWDAANATIDRNATRHNCAGKVVNEYLLRGMIYCSECGEKRYGFTNRHGTVLYRCANHTLVIQKRRPEAMRCCSAHVRGDWIEAKAWTFLKDAIETPGYIEGQVRKALAEMQPDPSQNDLGLARANLLEQERIQRTFFEMWRDEKARSEPDLMLADRWEGEYRKLTGQVASLQRTVETLERRLATLVSPEQIARDAEAMFAEIRAKLKKGREVPFALKRQAFELARTFIEVQGNGHRAEHLAGGQGKIHFYLLDKGNHSVEFSARSSAVSAPIVVSLADPPA